MFQRVSIAVLFIIATSSQGARILGLFPVPARSHIIVFEPLMKELATRGHQVTVVSAFPLDKPMDNYTDIKLDMPDISKFMSDQGVSSARPLLPNVIQLGGIHIKPTKPLPEDIQDYIDSATEGVIFFSMGSIIQGSMLPETTRDAFLKVFSKLKQKVLWKLEVDSLPGQPANVKISKWLPQSDILAHPNVRVFISHGGLMSTLEASYHGVPILGIPCFGDQHQNILRVRESGYGLTLDLNNITETSVAWSLDELLNNSRYSSNARQISQDFRDQPQTPMERAVFWTEYVLRHDGAAHMRSSALDLNCQASIYFMVLLAVLVLFFLDAIREMKKYSSSEVDNAHGHLDAEMQVNMRLFRAQRNFYISGFALFLSLVIRRLVILISTQATLLAQSEAAMRQAKSATTTAQSLLAQNQASVAQNDTNEAHDREITELKEKLAKAEKALVLEKKDKEAIKSQAESVNAEYDRLSEEHRKLQATVESAGGEPKKNA
uniref:Bap31/Bap29 cytoplasmic coiled-coil domain-containing protein n=6 Tax=Timema TaxID=61471 RepID=A0A7R9B2U9_TIMSH|nr:unnamed protein product [Timema shepardi]